MHDPQPLLELFGGEVGDGRHARGPGEVMACDILLHRIKADISVITGRRSRCGLAGVHRGRYRLRRYQPGISRKKRRYILFQGGGRAGQAYSIRCSHGTCEEKKTCAEEEDRRAYHIPRQTLRLNINLLQGRSCPRTMILTEGDFSPAVTGETHSLVSETRLPPSMQPGGLHPRIAPCSTD